MNETNINNVADPILNLDAANKEYVDTSIGNATTSAIAILNGTNPQVLAPSNTIWVSFNNVSINTFGDTLIMGYEIPQYPNVYFVNNTNTIMYLQISYSIRGTGFTTNQGSFRLGVQINSNDVPYGQIMVNENIGGDRMLSSSTLIMLEPSDYFSICASQTTANNITISGNNFFNYNSALTIVRVQI